MFRRYFSTCKKLPYNKPWAVSENGVVKFESLTNKSFDGAINVVRESFIKTESLCKAVGLCHEPEAADELLQMCYDAGKDGVSIVANDTSTNEIVGVIFNKIHESLADWERGITGMTDVQGPPQTGALNRKWSARTAAHAQDTATDQSAPVNNSTDACKLLIYIGDAKVPMWRLNLCGGNAAAVAARAGTKLLPSKLRIVWNPPTSPYHHTEKLRLVVTAVNSGSICNNDSQFICGVTSLCISSYLVCDGVRHCPGGEDEDPSACSHRHDPPLLELLRRFAARNQELLGLDQPDGMTKPSVIMKIGESEKSSNAFMEFAAALKPYGPWSYLVVGMLVCATILMFCLAWECCCKRSKPSDTPMNIPPSCIDLSPTVTVTAASQQLFTQPLPPSPPEYEPPPSYSSLFPRAFKSSPTPVPHCSHQEPPD